MEALGVSLLRDADVVAVDEALNELAAFDARKARVGRFEREAPSPLSTTRTYSPAARPSNEQTPQRLPLTSAEPLGFFRGTDWSPDGRRLAGWAPTPSTGPGVYTYDFGTNGYERLTDFGSVPRRLSDGRRLLLMTEFKLFFLGGEAGKPREIMSVAPNRLLSYALSRDDRTLFYDVAETEADIWLLTQD